MGPSSTELVGLSPTRLVGQMVLTGLGMTSLVGPSPTYLVGPRSKRLVGQLVLTGLQIFWYITAWLKLAKDIGNVYCFWV